MISIRYANLPDGWHVQAVAEGSRTVIYLRPGLTPQQRWDSLRRVRRSARMGYGPRLTAAGVAIALAADSVRRTLANVAAAVRWHLLGSVLLVTAMAAGAVCYVVLVTLPIRLFGPPTPAFAFPRGPGGAHAPAGPGPGRSAAPQFPGGIAAGPSGGTGTPGSRPGPEGSPSPRQHSTPGPSPSGSPRPTPSPATPSPSRRPSPRPTGSPPPRPTRPPRPSPSPSQLCILIICLPNS